jgi:hypothetical protein
MKRNQIILILVGAGVLLFVYSLRAKSAPAGASTEVTGTTSQVPGITGNPFAVGRNAPQIPADYTGTTWGDPASNNYWVKNKAGNWVMT